MNQEARELYRLLTYVRDNPADMAARRVYADWLDDHDEPELAAEQREVCDRHGPAVADAEARLKDVADQLAGGDYAGMLKGAVEGGYTFSDESWSYEIDWRQFWDDVATVTGKAPERSTDGFRCAC